MEPSEDYLKGLLDVIKDDKKIGVFELKSNTAISLTDISFQYKKSEKRVFDAYTLFMKMLGGK